MKQNRQDYLEIDLLHVFKTLFRRAGLIIMVTVLAGMISFGYAYKLVPPKYESKALFYVNNSSVSIGGANFNISSSDLSAAQSLVDTYIVILESRTTLEKIIEQAGLTYSYQQLSEMISASAVNGTEIFSVAVQSTDPNEAALIANTICKVLPKTIANIVDGSDVRIVDYAISPRDRYSPSFSKYTAIGALIGFMLVCLVIIIADLMDDVIHEDVYLTQNYDYPLLASIPNLDEDKSKKHYGRYGKYYKKGYYEKYSYKDTYGREKGEQ